MQDIIVYTIIIVAVAVAIYSTVKSIRSGKTSGCGDCTACVTPPPVKETSGNRK